MTDYYVSYKAIGIQIKKVRNCKSKAEALAKIKAHDDNDVDDIDFRIIENQYTTASFDEVVDLTAH